MSNERVHGRLVSVTKLSVSATHADTSALSNADNTNDPNVWIRIATTTDLFFLVSAAGTAATTSNGHLLSAGREIVLLASKGDIVSTIRSTADGVATVSVIE